MKAHNSSLSAYWLHGLCPVLFLAFLVIFPGCARETKEEAQLPARDLKVARAKDKQSAAGIVLAPAEKRSMAYNETECMDYMPVEYNTEEYDHISENEFKSAVRNPLSTFSIDVDTASYSNVRRFITYNQLPPVDSVRIEEMVNYFTYDYPQPQGEHPFSITTEMSRCPWNSGNRLIHIGLQGKSLDYKNLKACNLVFLVDSSGSMSDSNKLPLLVKSLKLLVNGLGKNDRIAIVAYAGSAGLVLPSTPATKRNTIISAMESLSAGGSTAGGQGIELAYRVAKENIIAGGNNRVILCTDGDFNVGVSSTGDLVRMIEEKRKDDIYLTICGFGMGNYKDGRMEQISNAGNGNYFYIDSIREAEKVFVRDMRANMFTIAKDVKIQIEFNPLKVKAYRLVGYENRILAKEDFNNDKKDAGELGAGHTVTALYEIVPAGSKEKINEADGLKYQQTQVTKNASSGEIMTVKLRYKQPKSDTSILIAVPVRDAPVKLEKSSDNFRFSAAVAGFGMLLRDSQFKKDLTFSDVLTLARASKGKDAEGYRAEFISLVETCALLKK
ncbi:MAG TPA: von Willebrand factor type A domain-containing protein [Spirochaetota bacterium]|nr:von Willebrand factor type A domain-containing protein [Spirochaetota bacterium]HPI90766.1 von Willebrand factor type A domain-containing protein [Spirochaetota bacterium]HPR48500.1 von Willebrand factor type A domain-containing protein [Spirochaetota bacterium]